VSVYRGVTSIVKVDGVVYILLDVVSRDHQIDQLVEEHKLSGPSPLS
jgi:hypothetical protein